MGVRKTGQAPPLSNAPGRKTNKPPLQTVGPRRLGVAMVDLVGRSIVLGYEAFLTTVGAGNVNGPGTPPVIDNSIARWDGVGGRLLQDGTPTVEDDWRISNVTDPSSPQDVATKAYVDASGGGSSDIVVQWTVNDGATATVVGPYLLAPRNGDLNLARYIVKAVGSAPLVFDILKGGVSILTAPVTIPTSVVLGTAVSFTLAAVPTAIVVHEVFVLEITTGETAWSFHVQVET